MTETKIKILLVEDDENLGFVIKTFLEMEGFLVSLQNDGERGLKAFTNSAFDLCILDVMMPRKDGFTLATQIRAMNDQIPLLFLTAKSLKEDKLKGFGIGADDYITKPFDEDELVARIHAILARSKRTASNQKQSNFELGEYIFEPEKQLLTFRKEQKRLTERENNLLLFLCSHSNEIVKREKVLEAVWGENDYFLGRSLDVFITKLRKYLKKEPNISIENIHGVGFMLLTNKKD